jgi:putative tryptophan/tyrosine transport system substrate-binding protein
VRRRDFITLAGAATMWSFATGAQEAGRTYRLGMLMPFPRDHPFVLGFLGELRNRGFVEGQNLAIEYRDFGPNPELSSQ